MVQQRIAVRNNATAQPPPPCEQWAARMRALTVSVQEMEVVWHTCHMACLRQWSAWLFTASDVGARFIAYDAALGAAKQRLSDDRAVCRDDIVACFGGLTRKPCSYPSPNVTHDTSRTHCLTEPFSHINS